MTSTNTPRTYAVCVYCKHRRTDRSLFEVDPYFPQAGVTYRCKDRAACRTRQDAKAAAKAEPTTHEHGTDRSSGADVLTATSTTPAWVTGQPVERTAAEYTAWIDHLCTPKDQGGHGLGRESVTLVAHTLAGAQKLHRMQGWHSPVCAWTPDKTTCGQCGEEIFQRPDGTWDLVYRLQQDTKICFWDHGTQNDDAFYANRPHVPVPHPYQVQCCGTWTTVPASGDSEPCPGCGSVFTQSQS